MPPTKNCKICFKEIKISDFCRLFDCRTAICPSCQRQLEPKFISFEIDGYKSLAIYDYNDFIKNLIYLYKGCFDYEMREVFLNLFLKELSIKYKGYIVVPAPSFCKDDERRGFNHVEEVFSLLGLTMKKALIKTSHFKQAEKGAKKRQQIRKHLTLIPNISLKNEDVLIVDDIYTTGATLKTAINLIEKLNPRSIKILVLAKTIDLNKRKSNTN